MKRALFIVLAASIMWGSCAHQVRAQEKPSVGQPAALEVEGVLIASDDRSGTITVDTGRDKVALAFNRATAIKALSKDSPRSFYESRGGVLLSIGLARILVGDTVHVRCEAVKNGNESVCRTMTIESVATPGSQKHTRLPPVNAVPSLG
jgi:hypothetical protein